MPSASDFQRQYQACLTTVGLYHRQDRGLIELRGNDRAAWLNNLVTNVITTVSAGDGNYAFATSREGRTIFDLNMLVLEDRIWLDIDRRRLEAALAHLDRYLICEDVKMLDLTAQTGRFAILGPQTSDVAERLGFTNLTAMAWLQHVSGTIDGREVRMMRHDFAGLVGAEFFITGTSADEDTTAIIAALSAKLELSEVDHSVIETLRIEAGIPASVEDIDEDVLPPETGQVERGINSQKGCYLGQEVLERMRSRSALARRLVGIRFEGDAPVPPGSKLIANDKPVGRVMSGCISPALGAPLSLAYLKTANAEAGTPVVADTTDGPRPGTTTPLPARPLASSSPRG